jgi:hypothetical protein
MISTALGFPVAEREVDATESTRRCFPRTRDNAAAALPAYKYCHNLLRWHVAAATSSALSLDLQVHRDSNALQLLHYCGMSTRNHIAALQDTHCRRLERRRSHYYGPRCFSKTICQGLIMVFDPLCAKSLRRTPGVPRRPVSHACSKVVAISVPANGSPGWQSATRAAQPQRLTVGLGPRHSGMKTLMRPTPLSRR